MQVSFAGYSLLQENYSVAAIARETDLPYRTLLAARNNYDVLNSKEKQKLGSLYKRYTTELYSQAGFSRSQARRMNENEPDVMRSILDRTNERIDYLIRGILTRNHDMSIIDLEDRSTRRLYNTYDRRIRDSISRNQTSYEWLQDPKY